MPLGATQLFYFIVLAIVAVNLESARISIKLATYLRAQQQAKDYLCSHICGMQRMDKYVL